MSQKSSLVPIILTSAILLASVRAHAEETAQLIIPRVGTPPVLDGEINDACWNNALHITDFTLAQSTDTPSKRVEAWVCFDEAALYLAFLCQEPNPEKIVAEVKNDGASVWKDDCVEIWIRTTGNVLECDQFIMNTLGSRQSLRRRQARDNRPFGRDWRGNVKVGVTDGKDWSVEIKVPHSEIGLAAPPKRGDMIQMKLGREDRGTGSLKLISWPPGSTYAGTRHYTTAYFETDNLIQNPDLSKRGAGGRPERWRFTEDSEVLFQAVKDAGLDVIRIDAPGRYCTMSQTLKLDPEALYLLSAKVRGSTGVYLRGRSKVKEGAQSRHYTANVSPSKDYQNVEVVVPAGFNGEILLIVGTTQRTGKGEVFISDLSLRKALVFDALGPAIPVKAAVVVKKLFVSDCRALRGSIGVPVDGSITSTGWNGTFCEYKKGSGGGTGVGYWYASNEGLHLELDGAFNYVHIRGGISGRMYAGEGPYDRPGERRLVHEFPGRTSVSRLSLDKPAAEGKVSFFDVGDGYLSDVQFFLVGDDEAALPPVTRTLAPGGKAELGGPKVFTESVGKRFESKHRTFYALADTPDGTLTLPANTWVHLLGNLNKGEALGAVELQLELAAAQPSVELSACVQDPLNPRSLLLGADFTLEGKQARIILDFPDQVIPEALPLWLSLKSSSNVTLKTKVVLRAPSPDVALKQALPYRLRLMRGYFGALSEPRPWNEFWNQQRVDDFFAGRRGSFSLGVLDPVIQLRDTIAQCKALAPNDPTATFYDDWFWKHIRRSDPQPFTPKLDNIPGAPEWAVLAHQAWLEARSVPEWWINNRLVPSGELGSGVGDDTDMHQNYVDFPMFERDGVAGDILDGAARLAELAEGRLEQGLNRNTTDPLHAYEEGVNHEAIMLWWNYGDPVYTERCIVAARSTEALTVMTPRGRFFKSQMLGSEDLRINRKTDTDGHAHPLMWHPALEVAWYNRSPKAVKMMREWADAWLKYQVPGVWATSVRVSDGEVTAKGNSPLAGGYGGQLSAFTFLADVTGDTKYIQPLIWDINQPRPSDRVGRVMPELLHAGWFDDVADIDKKLGRSPYAQYVATGNKAPLLEAFKRDITEMQRFRIYYTTAEVFTDRVFLYAIQTASYAYTGGHASRNRFWHRHAVSWDGFGTDYAALVRTARPDTFSALVYNFSDEPLNGTMTLWRLDHGIYSLQLGPDENGDDKADRIDRNETLEVARATTIPVTLPPKKTTVITLKQTEKLDSIFNRADLALSPLDTTVHDGSVQTFVHNIGAKDAGDITVALVNPNGDIVSSKSIAQLAAPLDLVPKKVELVFGDLPGQMHGWALVVDPDGKIAEIYEGNNRVELAKALVMPYKPKRLAEPRPPKQAAPTPAAVEKKPEPPTVPTPEPAEEVVEEAAPVEPAERGLSPLTIAIAVTLALVILYLAVVRRRPRSTRKH